MATPKLGKYEYVYFAICPFCNTTHEWTFSDLRREICYTQICITCSQVFNIATKDACLTCLRKVECLTFPGVYYARKRVRSNSYRKMRKTLRRANTR